MATSDFWRSAVEPERILLTHVTRWQAEEQVEREEQLTVEEPLEIRLAGQNLAVIMRTPGHDPELVAGFLLTEGVVHTSDEVLQVSVASDSDGLPLPNVVDVMLTPERLAEVDLDVFQRHFPVSTSCGLCGKDSISSALASIRQFPDDHLQLPASLFYTLPDRLRQAQAVFDHTGGLHAAGLFTAQGELLLLREDVGRHNAVDKLIGHGLLHATLPYTSHILLVSGRTSFEIIQKALVAGIPCVAAISAPSSLAVELATRSGLTLLGFLRTSSMNVYTHPARIVSC